MDSISNLIHTSNREQMRDVKLIRSDSTPQRTLVQFIDIQCSHLQMHNTYPGGS